MRRNSNIIGPVQNTTTASAIGIFDTFDQFNIKKETNWPFTPKVTSLTPSTTTLDETNNRSVAITVNTEGFANATTLYWTINQVSGTVVSGDFSSGFTGSFTLSGNVSSATGTINIQVATDFEPDGTDVFNVQVRTVSTSGDIIATSANITISDTSIEPPQEAWTGNVITATGQNGTTSPGIINIYYRRTIIMWSYTSAELQAAFGKSSATISGLRFTVTGQPANQPLPNYAIGMKNGTFGSSSPGNTGYTIVKSASSESFTSGTVKTFSPLTTSFSWTGGDLAIIFAWGQCPTTYNASGVTPTGAGTSWYTWTDSSGTYTINIDNPASTVNYRPVLQLFG